MLPFYLVAGALAAGASALQGLAPRTPVPPSESALGADSSGLATLLWSDVDGDGLDDLLALRGGALRLLRDDGTGQLIECTGEYGLAGHSALAAAGFVDFDLDGHLDLFLLTANGEGQLLRNESGAAFVDATLASGLSAAGPILKAEWTDVNRDARPDLVIWTPESVLVNRNLDGRFDVQLLDLPTVAAGVAGGAGSTPGTLRGAFCETDRTPAGESGGSARAGDGERPRTGGGGGRPLSPGGAGGPGFTVTGERAGPRTLGMSLPKNCSARVLDEATQSCVKTSSVPALGQLYPLSSNLNVDAATGRVGVGTTSPTSRLHVESGGIIGPGKTALYASGTLHGARVRTTSSTEAALYAEGDLAGFFEGRMSVGTDGLLGELERVVLDTDTDGGGTLEARADNSATTVALQAQEAVGNGPQLDMYSFAGVNTFTLDAEQGSQNGAAMHLRNGTGQLTLYHDADDGDLGGVSRWYMADGTQTVEIQAEEVAGDGGQITIENAAGIPTIYIDGDVGHSSSQVAMYTAGGVKTVQIDSEEVAGNGAQIVLRKVDGTASIVLDAEQGGIGRITTEVLEITGGADLVESFETGAVPCPPGSVVVIDADSPGALTLSGAPYDTRVAGVVSGAGDVRPGLHLGQTGVTGGDTQVALTGRVYVRCSDENGPIRAGDLLTSSSTPGLAMRATDTERSFGAVLGKAMGALEGESGLVLTLVNLQ